MIWKAIFRVFARGNDLSCDAGADSRGVEILRQLPNCLTQQFGIWSEPAEHCRIAAMQVRTTTQRSNSRVERLLGSLDKQAF